MSPSGPPEITQAPRHVDRNSLHAAGDNSVSGKVLVAACDKLLRDTEEQEGIAPVPATTPRNPAQSMGFTQPKPPLSHGPTLTLALGLLRPAVN